MPTYQQLEAIVLEASAEALCLFRESDVKARRKDDGSWVTDADETVEDLLVGRLEEQFPDLAILAEERTARGQEDGHRGRDIAAIDPIDGTASFIAGTPFWTISAGILRQGRPVLGIITAPAIGTSFGTDGETFWHDGTALEEAEVVAPLGRQSVLLVPSSAHRRFDLTGFEGKTRSYGSTAHHLALVARGSVAAALCRRGSRLWDIAAGLALATCRGLVARHLDGRPLDLTALLDGQGAPSAFLVAAPEHHSTLAALVVER